MFVAGQCWHKFNAFYMFIGICVCVWNPRIILTYANSMLARPKLCSIELFHACVECVFLFVYTSMPVWYSQTNSINTEPFRLIFGEFKTHTHTHRTQVFVSAVETGAMLSTKPWRWRWEWCFLVALCANAFDRSMKWLATCGYVSGETFSMMY